MSSGGDRGEAEVFQFRLEFADDQGQVVASEPLIPGDFHRAVAETCFAGFREGVFPSYAPDPEFALVEPVFRRDGPPERTEGFRVTLRTPGLPEYSREFGAGYVGTRAGRIKARIVRDRKLGDDATLYYTLAAYLDEASIPPRRSQLLSEPAEVRLPLGAGRREAIAPREEWDSPSPDDLPVVIPHSVLQEACEEASAHPGREIGGLLIGQLHRHGDSTTKQPGGQMFLEVTCLVSGEGTTPATATSVTFTPESFARARELIRLRAKPGREGEIIVGWYHSHPFRFCDKCPLPVPPECLQKVLFYSSDDLNVMESAFGQPYHVGLLAAIEPRIEGAIGHLPVKLYGWRNGETVARGFEVYRDE